MHLVYSLNLPSHWVVWWLNFMCQFDWPRDAQVKQYFPACLWERFWRRWAFESADSVDFHPQCGWASSNPLKARVEQNVEEGGSDFFFPASLTKLRHLISYSPALTSWDLHRGLTCFSGFHTRARAQSHQWLCWAFNWQMAERGTSQPPSLHMWIPHSTSPFLSDCPSIHRYLFIFW